MYLIQKPTDLDLHYLQRQGISGISRTRVNFKLLLSMLGKNFSRQHFEIFFLFFFSRKETLFHANCFLRNHFA